jgi:gluconolactonase
VPNRTYDVVPHAQAIEFDDTSWERLAPADTMRRLSTGRVCFNWYRIEGHDPPSAWDRSTRPDRRLSSKSRSKTTRRSGSTARCRSRSGWPEVRSWPASNAPDRVLLTRDARPGDRFQIAVFGINGPISASLANHIWMRTATLDFYAAERAPAAEWVAVGVERADPRLEEILPSDVRVERVAGGL